MNYNVARGIRIQRMKRNISQKGLGIVLGVSRCQISNWEIGRRDITVREAVNVANFFKITLDELVDPKELR